MRYHFNFFFTVLSEMPRRVERTSNHGHTIAESQSRRIFRAQCGFFQLEAPFDSHFSNRINFLKKFQEL